MSFFTLPKPKVWRRRRKRAAVRQRRQTRALRAKDWTPLDWFFRLSMKGSGVTETPQQKQPRRVAPARLSPAPHLRKSMPKAYRCSYRGTWFDSDTDMSGGGVYACFPVDSHPDVEQPKPNPAPTGTLNPFPNADLPGTEDTGTILPTDPGDAWTRDRDGAIVPEGTPFDSGPFASIYRFPTRFLPDSWVNGASAKLVPIAFWLLVAWILKKAFRR